MFRQLLLVLRLKALITFLKKSSHSLPVNLNFISYADTEPCGTNNMWSATAKMFRIHDVLEIQIFGSDVLEIQIFGTLPLD
jgi:hypothetical protein